MSTFGLRTYNGSGEIFVESLSSSQDYYLGDSIVASAQTLPSYPNAVSYKNVSTYSENYSVSVLGNRQSGGYIGLFNPSIRANVGAVVEGGGSNRILPLNNSADSYDNTSGGVGINISTAAIRVNRFARKNWVSDNYGVSTRNSFGEVLVDETHKSLYYQPLNATTLERTAYIRPEQNSNSLIEGGFWGESDPNAEYWIPSTVMSSGQFIFSNITNQTVRNIVFPKAYTNPPLIFLTNSNSARVCIRAFITNSRGKYTGASIAVARTLTNHGSSIFLASSAATISYFLVSDEPPDYLNTAVDYGLFVYNGAGAMVFDSRYPVASMTTSFIPASFSPYFRKTHSGSTITSRYHGGYQLTFPSQNVGVLLNSMPYFAGYSFYFGNIIFQTGFPGFNVFGHYVEARRTSNSLVATVTAGGSFGAHIPMASSWHWIRVQRQFFRGRDTEVMFCNPTNFRRVN